MNAPCAALKSDLTRVGSEMRPQSVDASATASTIGPTTTLRTDSGFAFTATVAPLNRLRFQTVMALLATLFERDDDDNRVVTLCGVARRRVFHGRATVLRRRPSCDSAD
jgi:hypothetical protein